MMLKGQENLEYNMARQKEIIIVVAKRRELNFCPKFIEPITKYMLQDSIFFFFF